MPQAGGIETPYALGQPNIGEAIAAGNAASAIADPNAVNSVPTQTTTQQQVDPTAQGTAAQYQLTVNSPDYGGRNISNEDLGARDPYVIHSGKNTFSEPAYMGPGAAIAARQQALANERAANTELANKLFAGDDREKVDPRYARAYGKHYDAAEKEYYASILARHGGREDRAAKALAGKDPNDMEAYRGYMRLHRDQNDLGRAINHDVPEAEKVIADMQSGALHYDEDTFNAATDVVRGFGQGGEGLGNINMLKDSLNKYHKAVTPEFLLNSIKADDTMQKFAALTHGDLQLNDLGRGYKATSYDAVKSYEGGIQNLADNYHGLLRDQYPTREEFVDYLHKRYPLQTELTGIHTFAPQKPSKGSASGSGASDKGYNAVYQYGPTNVSGRDKLGDDVVRPVDQVLLFDVTSNQGRFPVARQASDGSYIHPVSVYEDDNGKKWIYGKVGKAPGARVAGSGDPTFNLSTGMMDGGSTDVSTTEDFNTLADKVIPYKGNEGFISGSFPGLTEGRINKTIADGRKGRNSEAPGAANDIGAKVKEAFPDAVFDDGVWKAKNASGKWVKVNVQ